MSARTEALNAERDPRFLNRQRSELAFIRRVLEEAENSRHPVVERLKFLGITGLLLDEFYRLRIATLRERIRASSKGRGGRGATARAELAAADRESDEILEAQERCWQQLCDELDAAGISVTQGEDLSPAEAQWLERRVRSRLLPLFMPIVLAPEAPLPFVKDGEIVSLIELESPDGKLRRALVPLPRGLPRFVALKRKRLRFIALEDVLALCVEQLFPEHRVAARGLARVVREGSLKLKAEEEDVPDLVRTALERRERADVIRLEVDPRMPEHLQCFLAEGLGLITRSELDQLHSARKLAVASEFIVADRPLGLVDTLQLVEALRGKRTRDLRFSPVEPAWPEFVGDFDGDFFAAVAAQDRLLHFPYDDFDVLTGFLEQAAEDADVVSIRQTLYRAGKDSPVVKALARAARQGKQVTAVIELEARDDERANIELADKLRAAGATVTFGLRNLKVHVKAIEVVRRERGTTRRYVNFATGNYHLGAGRTYTDLSLFSARPELAADAAALFTYLIDGVKPRFSCVAVAPDGMRARLIELIDREARHAAVGRPAAIWLKVNRLSDVALIEALYRAAQAGVAIDIVVRGVCCLRPGVPGLSELITVKSVVGRFLEHSRFMCFGAGHGLPSMQADVFLSSADWMPQKLDHRVEVLVPIEDEVAKRRILDVMPLYLRDEAQSWRLDAAGAWRRVSRAGFSAQEALMETPVSRSKRARIVRTRR